MTYRDCPLGDPADDYDPVADERAEYDAWEIDIEPHPGHLFPAPPDETEAALMAADELVESLDDCDGPAPEPSDYTPAPPTMAERWPPAERAEMARRLERLGTTITELSDVRELLGLPRLSASTTQARALAHHLLAGKRGKRALATVRAERAHLSVGVAPSRAARLRLSELRALVALGGVR